MFGTTAHTNKTASMDPVQDISNRRTEPDLSIIMPLYNVEDYLEDNLTALLENKNLNFELILIDDASSDNSLAIAQRFAKTDTRVLVQSLDENTGVAFVRNLGIKLARAPWIWMPDSDDTYSKDALEVFERALKASTLTSPSPDVILFGHREQHYAISTTPDGSSRIEQAFSLDHRADISEESYKSNKVAALMQLEQENHLGYPYNKLYKRSLILEHSLAFEDLPLLEDFFFNIQYFSYVENIACISQIIYTYHKRQTNSLTNQFVPEYFALHRRRIAELYRFAEERGGVSPKCKQILGSLYARYILSALERNIASHQGLTMDNKELYQFLKTDEFFKELIPYASSESSKVLDLWIFTLKTLPYCAWIFFALTLYLVRHRFPNLVTRIKSQR